MSARLNEIIADLTRDHILDADLPMGALVPAKDLDKLKTQARQQYMAELVVARKTEEEIADLVGLSLTAVIRQCKSPEVRELVTGLRESARERRIDKLNEAVYKGIDTLIEIAEDTTIAGGARVDAVKTLGSMLAEAEKLDKKGGDGAPSQGGISIQIQQMLSAQPISQVVDVEDIRLSGQSWAPSNLHLAEDAAQAASEEGR